MATFQAAGGIGSDSLYDIQWLGLAASADVGTPITVPPHVNWLTVAVEGTFTGSLAIQLQGSNDGTNYHQLKDITNTAISFTAAGIVAFQNPPKYIKPVATAGSGGAVANVYIHGGVNW